jgi:hypothetical protein
MKKRKVQIKRIKSKRPAAAGKKKRSPFLLSQESRGAKRGPKTEIQGLQSPPSGRGSPAASATRRDGPAEPGALVQMLIRAAADYTVKPQRKSERNVVRATKELLIRLGHSRKEAGILTEKIMEQMQ